MSWLLLGGVLLGACQVWKPTASGEYQPQPQPMGPLTIGVWLPAGLDEFRFGPADQQHLLDLGLNTLEWVQRTGQDSATAEERVMEFCSRTGLRMPVYYEPRGYSPYDKLRNWATRTEVDSTFAAEVRRRVLGLRGQWGEAPGFWGYLVGHEDYQRAFYPALRATVEILQEEDGARPAIAVGRLDHFRAPEEFLDAFFPASGNPNIFQHEHYVFRADLSGSGEKVQEALDQLARSYEQVAWRLQGRNGRWQAIVQAHAEWRERELYYRKPSAGELRVQAGMALARGAAGIIYFLYSSGVEELLDARGQVRGRWAYEGLVDAQGIPTESFGAARQLSAQLRQAGQVLELLHFHGFFSSSRLRDNPLVRQGEADLDFGLFGDGEHPTHLLVVNRRPEQARRVALELRPGMELRFGTVADALQGTPLPSPEGRVELELEAGGFRLLELRETIP
ncbi:MAG: hypothetical protein HYW07_21550 [Candidatus Latescibacteria bacterium]|nr:hypothetical protein [Candidatus Latescibacterota bacterium]